MARVVANEAVVVEGLDDFRRDLIRFSSIIDGKDFGKINKAAAVIVADAAEDIGRSLGGVHAHVVRTGGIRALAAARFAEVVVGGSGKKHGPVLGAEFGSHYYGQFPAWRGNQWQANGGGDVGYMLHPAIRETREEWTEVYWTGIEALARKTAYPKRD